MSTKAALVGYHGSTRRLCEINCIDDAQSGRGGNAADGASGGRSRMRPQVRRIFDPLRVNPHTLATVT